MGCRAEPAAEAVGFTSISGLPDRRPAFLGRAMFDYVRGSKDLLRPSKMD
jgi:hypothetical protein